VKCVLNLNIIEHFADAEDNKESVAKGKLTMPVLVLSDDIYPALGRDFPESTTLNSIQALAETCQKCNNTLFRALNSRVTLDFVLEQLSHFFGNITNEINKNISYLTITSLNNIFFQITLISFKKLKVKS
jgi:hypothetical protein